LSKNKFRAWGEAQMAEPCLISHKVLSSDPSTAPLSPQKKNLEKIKLSKLSKKVKNKKKRQGARK
jgi:hypothetical protein